MWNPLNCATSMKTILFLHGWGGKGDAGNWQNVLAGKLAGLGYRVIYPDLPNANNPRLEEWVEALEEALEGAGDGAVAGDGRALDLSELTVATHSLGGVLWLHYVSRHLQKSSRQNGLLKPKIEAKSVHVHTLQDGLPGQSWPRNFLVAPPLTDCGIKKISDFFPLPEFGEAGLNGAGLAGCVCPGGINTSYLLVHSDNDPYIPLEDFEEFAVRFGMPTHVIKNAGHINVKSGYGDWDWMEKELAS